MSMDTTTLPWRGGCRCGQVRLEVTEPPLLASACHCEGCQRMSSSAFSLTLTVPASGFRVTAGEPVIGGLHGPESHHFFCPRCLTWMFTRAEGMDWFVNLRPTMLDEHRDFEPFIDMNTATRLPWATTPAVHGFEEFPPFEAYEGLIREYARRPAS